MTERKHGNDIRWYKNASVCIFAAALYGCGNDGMLLTLSASNEKKAALSIENGGFLPDMMYFGFSQSNFLSEYDAFRVSIGMIFYVS